METLDKLFWNGSIENIKKGYMYNSQKKTYICLICGEEFEEGIIYKQGELLCDAKRAVKNHIEIQHGDMFNYLLNLNKKFTGLSDVQKEILSYFYQGLSDNQIVETQGNGSTSTIRNHRFKFREKQRISKIFIALMELLDEKTSVATNKESTSNKKDDDFVEIHRGATMIDERFAITEQEKNNILDRYIVNGRIETLPSKEKRRIIILQYIIEKFKPNREYTEKEVNKIIGEIYDDYVTIRRYFIEYGFMERTKDCSKYWIKI